MPCDTRAKVCAVVGGILAIIGCILFTSATSKLNSVGDTPWILRDDAFLPEAENRFQIGADCPNYPSSRANTETEWGTLDCTEKTASLFVSLPQGLTQDLFYGEGMDLSDECTYNYECEHDGGICSAVTSCYVLCGNVEYTDGTSYLQDKCFYNGLEGGSGEDPPVTVGGTTYYNIYDMQSESWSGFDQQDIDDAVFFFDWGIYKDQCVTPCIAASFPEIVDLVDLSNSDLAVQMTFDNGANAFSEGAATFFNSMGDYLLSLLFLTIGSIFFCVACCCACGCCGGDATVVVVQENTQP